MVFGFCPECNALIQEDGSGHFPYCAIVVTAVKETIDLIESTGVTVAEESEWGNITGKTVERLRKPKVPDVPAHVIKLAQASFDENAFKEHDFGAENKERAAKFARHLKNAGLHTSPHTSVSVAVNPDGEGEGLVRWKAGARRGRGAEVS